MIHCNLSVLLAERRLKISRVAADTGLSRTTLTALAYNDSQGIQMNTLNTLCIYLDICPSDLFSFYPYDFILEQIQGTLDCFTIRYFIRNRLVSGQCTLSGSGSILLSNEQWSSIPLQLKFSGIDPENDRLFSEAFALLTPQFKNDLEANLIKKFVTDVFAPGGKVGPRSEIKFSVIWPQ